MPPGPFESPDGAAGQAELRRDRDRWEHGVALFRRLQLLISRGYRPVFDPDFPGLELTHANPAARAIQLWPDGQVADLFPSSGEGNKVNIKVDDDERFRRFLRSVPPLPLHLRLNLEQLLFGLMAWVIAFLFVLGAANIFNGVGQLFAGR